MFGISRSSVGRAKAILKHALLVAAVESGAVTVGAAWEIQETDAEAQRKALEAVATGTATSLLAALEQNAPKDPDGVASDHAAARRSGRSASGPPGAEPNGALQEESAPSDPPSAASGPSASNGASAAARRPDSGSERAPVSDPSSGTSSHSLRPRATSGDTPGGTAPNMEDTDAADAARPALAAASDLRRSLDDLGHAVLRTRGCNQPELLAPLRMSVFVMVPESDQPNSPPTRHHRAQPLPLGRRRATRAPPGRVSSPAGHGGGAKTISRVDGGRSRSGGRGRAAAGTPT